MMMVMMVTMVTMVMLVMILVMVMVMVILMLNYKAPHRVGSIYDKPGYTYPPTFKVKISGM